MSLSEASPEEAAKAASLSSRALASLPLEARNEALQAVHDALVEARASILDANKRDVALARQAASSGKLSQSVLKRLDLGRAGKYDDMLKGILDVKRLEDPGLSRTRLLWLYTLTLHSRENKSTNQAGRRLGAHSCDVPNRSAFDHLRGET